MYCQWPSRIIYAYVSSPMPTITCIDVSTMCPKSFIFDDIRGTAESMSLLFLYFYGADLVPLPQAHSRA